MAANYFKDDPTFGKIDLDDEYITDAFVIDRYVGNSLFTWGAAAIAEGAGTFRSSPVQVGSNVNWKFVSTAHNDFSAAIKTDGTLWLWGKNNYNQLGLGVNAGTTSSPTQVGTGTTWRQVTNGGNHSVAIRTDNTIWSWGGLGTNGCLGQNSALGLSTPVQIGTLTNWKLVESAAYTTLAVKTDGTLWGWGANFSGALGQGNTTTRSSPVQIGTGTTWKQASISGNASHAAAIMTDGTLWLWGNNNYGQLGRSNTTSISSPVQVGSLTNWKQVVASYNKTLAVKTDGTLWAMGRNVSGELGLGNITSRSSPVQVGSLTNWKMVTGGKYHSMAIKTDGTLWAIGGAGSVGQLGLGNITARSSPIQVGSLNNWKQVAGNINNSIAITFADIT